MVKKEELFFFQKYCYLTLSWNTVYFVAQVGHVGRVFPSYMDVVGAGFGYVDIFGTGRQRAVLAVPFLRARALSILAHALKLRIKNIKIFFANTSVNSLFLTFHLLMICHLKFGSLSNGVWQCR